MHASARFISALLFAGLAAAPAPAQPGGTINTLTSATYSQNAAPTSETDTFDPANTNFIPAGGGTNVALNWWYYRVAGDTRERPFGIYTKSDGFGIAGSSSYPTFPPGGPTATYHWTENGAAGVRFTATYSLTVSGGPTNSDARLDQSFQVTNPNSTALQIVLFNLTFPEPGFHRFGIVGYGNSSVLSFSDGTFQLTHSAVGPSAYQIAFDQALINELTDGTVNDLNNTGLPFGGDRPTDAFEWMLSIPANSSTTVQSSLIIARGVPEPSALFLASAAASGAVGLRRWRHPNSATAPARKSTTSNSTDR